MNHFGIFAKYWAPGRVKTRLAASIGNEAAADVYRAFLVSLTQNLNTVGDTREVSIVPFEESQTAFAELAGPAWKITPQSDGDLGAKMNAYFETAFASGAHRVVLIGSDSPQLTPENIAEAFERLGETSVVLGPTADGGYYLVGAAKRSPPIFQNVSWSTPDVWRQTVAQLESAGVSYTTLRPQIDVDEWADLQQLGEALVADSVKNNRLYEVVRKYV